jgi:hypothetical protein
MALQVAKCYLQLFSSLILLSNTWRVPKSISTL